MGDASIASHIELRDLHLLKAELRCLLLVRIVTRKVQLAMHDSVDWSVADVGDAFIPFQPELLDLHLLKARLRYFLVVEITITKNDILYLSALQGAADCSIADVGHARTMCHKEILSMHPLVAELRHSREVEITDVEFQLLHLPALQGVADPGPINCFV